MIRELRPDDVPDYMEDAWLSCVLWAAGNPDIVKAFTADTGLRLLAPRSALDLMIDEATGAHQQIAESFVRWVNINVWGPVK